MRGSKEIPPLNLLFFQSLHTENHKYKTMEEIVKKYTNGEVTVVWKPKICIHSGICWHGLPEVFNPNGRPWVNVDDATSEQIIHQVRQCPSGALSYFMNEKSNFEQIA